MTGNKLSILKALDHLILMATLGDGFIENSHFQIRKLWPGEFKYHPSQYDT